MSKLSAFFTNRREKTLDILKNMDLDFAALQKKKIQEGPIFNERQ